MNEFDPEKFLTANSLEGQIESFSGPLAVIRLDDGQKLNWPAANLPAETAVGSRIRLRLTDQKTEAVEQAILAKKILNEILKEN